MSMSDEVRRRCSAEELVSFVTDPPTDPADPDTRTLLLSRAVNFAFELGLAEGAVPRGSACFDLAQYCEGERVTVRRPGYDRDGPDNPAFFVRLEQRREEPPAVWEVRFTEFAPQIRLFAFFYDYNRFMALTWANKGRGEPIDYAYEMRCGMAAWIDLFGVALFPFRPGGVFPDGYLSRAELVP